MSRKPTEIDPNGLAYSRQRRSNAGIPRQNPDGTIHDAAAARAKQADKKAKASAATEIAADPFTGDDAMAREPLPTFNPPTPTGDEQEDHVKFDKVRTDFLIRYIMIRDALDVRPALQSGELDLAGLEEIFEDAEAAAEDPSGETQHPPHPESSGKGKSKATTTPDMTNRGQAQTGYDGITMDTEAQAVTAKYAPKSVPNQQGPLQGTKRFAEQSNDPQKIQRTASPANAGLKSTPTGPPNPLRRTDSTTLVDGKRLQYPNFFTPRPNPDPSPTFKGGNTTIQSTRHVSGTQQPSKSNNASNRVVSSPAQLASASASGRANINRGLRVNQPGHSGLAQHRASSAATPAAGAAHPSSAREAVNMLRQKGLIKQSAPAQAVHPQAQQLDQAGPNEDADMEEAEQEEEEAPVADKPNKGRGKGKAYVNTFPVEQQPAILTMTSLAKVRSLANGTYDETESTVREPYPNYPEDWQPRLTRSQIAASSLTDACKEMYLDEELRFCLRHVEASTIAITSMRTLALKAVIPVVDRYFQFHIYTKDDWNKDMAKSLLPLNFVYGDIRNKKAPFENPVLTLACRAVAFNKSTGIGARHREELHGIPPGFLVFVCTLIKFILFEYQKNGEYTNPQLDVEVQTSAFRQCFKFLIETQQNKGRQLTNIRMRMWDECAANLGPKDNVRELSPLPEREWSPDATEVYVSQYDQSANFIGGHEDAEMAGNAE
ncbi:hypothetical protein FRC09_004370 [Ceratobasidium sp. 395]|nr:hypothetical protein FRC09_004370 [Ceratobasidium sp. 395]